MNNKRTAQCILFLLLILGVISCSNDSSIAFLNHKSYAERYLLIDSIQKNKPHDLPKYIKIAEQEGDYELTLELKLSNISYQMYSLKSESVEKIESELSHIIERAHAENYIYIEANATHAMGGLYWALKSNKNLGFNWFNKAYHLYKNFTADEFPELGNFLYQYAGNFYGFDDYEIAAKFFYQSYKIDKYIDTGTIISSINSLGLCYRNLNKFDSALIFFNEGLQTAKKLKQDSWKKIIEGNIGSIYFLQGKLDEAEPLLQQEVQRGRDTKDLKGTASTLIMLAEMNLKRNNLPLAFSNIKEAEVAALKLKSPDFRLLNKLYKTLSKIYAAQKDYNAALAYSDSAESAKINLQKLFDNILMGRSQIKLDEEIHQAEMQSQQSLNNYIRNSLIIGIILIAIIGLMFINRLKIIYKQKQKEADAEREKIKKELEYASSKLDEFTKNIEEKNELIENFSTELEKMNKVSEADPELVHQLQRSIILTDEQWADFTLLFEKVHGNFFHRLQNKIPGLSPADTRFVALSKLNLSNKTMAGMLGISPNSIRMSKHRLLKKLNLEEDAELDKLIESI